MTKTIRVNRLRGRIDFLVITIREDEFEAVLKRFSPRLPVIGGRQGYEYCRLKRPDGRYVNVAVVRAIDQGQSIAQSVAHNAINDLNPSWLVLVGIAGGIADNDFSLGDVLLASSLHDFSITAAIDGESPQLRPSGGPVHPVIARLLAVLPAWRNRLGNWNDDASVGLSRPTVAVPNELTASCYYGSDASRVSVRNSLQSNFLGAPRKPLFRIGAVATANVLLKDTELLSEWKKAARHITHVEMEAGGVYVAARYGADSELPLLCIRGISDIVGFKREPIWTGYSCDTAASLFHALISELPIEQLTVSTSKPKIALLDAFSALPVAFLRLADGTRDLYRLTVDAFRAWASQEKLQTPSLEDIIGAFKTTSQPLLSRAVNPEDRIPRNEFVTLREFVSGDSAESVLCLLGGPGTGKTALLAHLAQHAMAENMVTLAIKADTVPVENSFDNWSKSEIGLDVSALDAVRAAAARSEVLVIVDQLDALSGTVDLTSDRLDAVINFIRQCSDMGGVRVVCSCRSFDYDHDARFTSLNARVVNLTLPEWEHVSAQLAKHGITNSETYPADFQELLKNPQHLQVFISRFEQTGRTDEFRSYHLMLDDLWARLVTDAKEQAVLYSLTDYLISKEELWAPKVKFDDNLDVLQSLETKGILQTQGLRIGFRHQTLLEHAKARLFTTDDKSLTEHVLKLQGAIHVRPTVWAVLQYLRDASPAKYRMEIESLFASDLRLHMRYLLIEFLGRLNDPEEFEAALIGPRLLDEGDRIRALISIRGRSKYFDELYKTHFPTIMRGPVALQWPIIGVITDAFSFNREACLTLIEQNWLPDPAKDGLTQRVMSGLAEWDRRAVDIVRTLVRRTTDEGDRLFWAENLTYLIAESQPSLAPSIFVETMRRIDENAKKAG